MSKIAVAMVIVLASLIAPLWAENHNPPIPYEPPPSVPGSCKTCMAVLWDVIPPGIQVYQHFCIRVSNGAGFTECTDGGYSACTFGGRTCEVLEA